VLSRECRRYTATGVFVLHPTALPRRRFEATGKIALPKDEIGGIGVPPSG
jgi:hypothetical protein